MIAIKGENGHTIAFWSEKKLLDEYGRPVIELHNNGKIVLFRYTNTNNELKYIVADMYNVLTNKEEKDIIAFLNFDNEMFCS